MHLYRLFPAVVLSFSFSIPLNSIAANKSDSDIAKLAQAAADAAHSAAVAAKAASEAAEAANKALAALQAAVSPPKVPPKTLTEEEALNKKAEEERILAKAQADGAKYFDPSLQKKDSASWIYVSSLDLGDGNQTKVVKDPPLRFYRVNPQAAVPKIKKPFYQNHSLQFENQESLPKMVFFEPGREIWEKGHEINIGYIVPGSCSKLPDFVTFTEEERASLLQNQAKQLAGSLVKNEKSSTNTGDETYCIYDDSYVLQEKRGNLKIDVKGSGADERKVKSATIITGPKEHWYLSTDARINSVKELTYDTATKSATEKKKSGNVYLGLNYMIGDILTDHGLGSWDNFGVKLMVNAHDKPLDSIGLGISYQLKSNVLGTSLPVSYEVFGGYFRQKGQNGAAGKGEWAWGISYNFVSGEKPKESAAKEAATKK